MKTKRTIITLSVAAIVLIAGIALLMNQQSNIKPAIPDDAPLPPIQAGDFTATDYPVDMPVEAISGVLGSLSAYVDNILNPNLTVESFLSVAHQNQILRINVTETSAEAVLITRENAEAFTGEQDPLRATRQIVRYAANSGHTINDLTITDEVSTVGTKDFFALLQTATLVDGEDGAPNVYVLSDEARMEIIRYGSAMLAENRDTELFLLSDTMIAFVMCERYSEYSLLGSFSFLERVGDVYLLRTVIDFNC